MRGWRCRTAWSAIVLGLAIAALPLAPGAPSSNRVLGSADAERLVLAVEGDPAWNVDVTASHVPLPSSSSGVGPGSRLHIQRPDGTFLCTAAFVFNDGSRYLLGTAGHCLLPGGATATHGPGADYDPALTRVRVCISACYTGGIGAGLTGVLRELGPVVYARQTGPGGDVGNDFGLVLIPAELMAYVRPHLPTWRGPTTATPPASLGFGTTACHHGNGIFYGEAWLTKSRTASGMGMDQDSWSLAGLAAGGDSGSAVVTCRFADGGFHGVAPLGVLTHGVGIIVAAGGLFFGTTTPQAVGMATQAGLSVSVVLEGAAV